MDNGNDSAHYTAIMKAEIDNQLVDELRSALEAQDPKVGIDAQLQSSIANLPVFTG